MPKIDQAQIDLRFLAAANVSRFDIPYTSSEIIEVTVNQQISSSVSSKAPVGRQRLQVFFNAIGSCVGWLDLHHHRVLKTPRYMHEEIRLCVIEVVAPNQRVVHLVDLSAQGVARVGRPERPELVV